MQMVRNRLTPPWVVSECHLVCLAANNNAFPNVNSKNQCGLLVRHAVCKPTPCIDQAPIVWAQRCGFCQLTPQFCGLQKGSSRQEQRHSPQGIVEQPLPHFWVYSSNISDAMLMVNRWLHSNCATANAVSRHPVRITGMCASLEEIVHG